MTAERYDFVVVGAGIGGLCTAALLARAGYRVAVLERHYMPGGYGHSFRHGGYTFCAQLHYLWNCNPGDDFDRLLHRLGLAGEITFSRLDRDGFDRLRFPSFRYDICSGFERNLARLAERYPGHRAAIARYFEVLSRINREVYDLPMRLTLTPFLLSPWKFRHVLRYRRWTTGDLFRHLGLPLEVRSILGGQSGDLLVPPSRASLLIQAALVCGYDGGACVPTRSYEHLFATLTDYINRQPGCRVILKCWVKRLELRQGRVVAAHGIKGQSFSGERFIYNGDPKRLWDLLDATPPRRFRRKLAYDYSVSNFTLYLGIRGLDLTRHGFGNWNVWHYAQDDIEACYRQQLEDNCLDNPSLFISTPTLHHKQAQIAPEGCEQMIVCTQCRYEHFDRLARQSRTAYLAEKQRVSERILDQLERHYLPGLRRHLDLVEAGTPRTNEKFVLAPQGNAYGASLTPANIRLGKIDDRTPYPNLYQVGATAGVPSFAGGVHFSLLLYEKLTGDRV